MVESFQQKASLEILDWVHILYSENVFIYCIYWKKSNFNNKKMDAKILHNFFFTKLTCLCLIN